MPKTYTVVKFDRYNASNSESFQVVAVSLTDAIKTVLIEELEIDSEEVIDLVGNDIVVNGDGRRAGVDWDETSYFAQET